MQTHKLPMRASARLRRRLLASEAWQGAVGRDAPRGGSSACFDSPDHATQTRAPAPREGGARRAASREKRIPEGPRSQSARASGHAPRARAGGPLRLGGPSVFLPKARRGGPPGLPPAGAEDVRLYRRLPRMSVRRWLTRCRSGGPDAGQEAACTDGCRSPGLREYSLRGGRGTRWSSSPSGFLALPPGQESQVCFALPSDSGSVQTTTPDWYPRHPWAPLA